MGIVTDLPAISSFELNKSNPYSSARCLLRQGHVKAEFTYSAAQVFLHISFPHLSDYLTHLNFNKYAKKMKCLKPNRLFSHIPKSQFSLIGAGVRLCQVFRWSLALVAPEYMLNVVHSGVLLTMVYQQAAKTVYIWCAYLYLSMDKTRWKFCVSLCKLLFGNVSTELLFSYSFCGLV